MALYIAIAAAVIVGIVAAAHVVIQKVIVPWVLLSLARPQPPRGARSWIVLRRRGTPRRD
ncbi:hypothetical protein [Streptomyces sp. NBC_00829]|uniref:hypothetical protein n=1 Tax=Streptomyces sp. NBC_00829 TaxID=2903679 RepID=UPI00386B3773|nr:hypothetical protein OG293_40775 [Streptomyces sp. NBC_00829]